MCRRVVQVITKMDFEWKITAAEVVYSVHQRVNSWRGGLLRKHNILYIYIYIYINVYITPTHWNGTDNWDTHWRPGQKRILHLQYHGCRWPGDARRQCINSDDIDQVLPEYYQHQHQKIKAYVALMCSIFQTHEISFTWLKLWQDSRRMFITWFRVAVVMVIPTMHDKIMHRFAQ